MELGVYISYKDETGRDVSLEDSFFYIKMVLKRYRRDVILSFLSFIAKEIGVVESPERLKEIQSNFGITTEQGVLIHSRAVLVLFQLFFETYGFDESNGSETVNVN